MRVLSRTDESKLYLPVIMIIIGNLVDFVVSFVGSRFLSMYEANPLAVSVVYNPVLFPLVKISFLALGIILLLSYYRKHPRFISASIWTLAIYSTGVFLWDVFGIVYYLIGAK